MTRPALLKGIIFDVDGVLFDSRRSNMAYYNAIRSAVSLPPMSLAEEDFCHMASAGEAYRHIIPPELMPLAMAAAHEIDYARSILPMLTPQEGLIEALYLLQSHELQLAILTNRTNTVEGLLHYFSLENFFWPIKTAQNSAPKPSPDGLLHILQDWHTEPEHVVFIGDSIVDKQAAEAAGVPFWAFGNPQLKADLHLTNYRDVIGQVTVRLG